MIVFPAIDLKGGQVVRLAAGDMDRATVYGDDPAHQATLFADAGADHLHVVDLEERLQAFAPVRLGFRLAAQHLEVRHGAEVPVDDELRRSVDEAVVVGDDAEDPGRVQGGGFRGGEVRGDEDRGAVEGELLPISWTEKSVSD